MTAVATTTAKPVQALRAELDRRVDQYAALLPKGYSPQRLIVGAMVAVSANPALLKCDPRSVALALARIAAWSLDVGETAHLVPYGNVCTPVADYKGYVKLMLQGGARKVVAEAVRDGEPFEFRRGTEEYLKHQPLGILKAPITHAYAIAWLKGMVPTFEVMTVEEIEVIRSKSQQWAKGPLTRWYARKSAIRQLRKYVPMDPRLVALDTQDEIAVTEDGEILTPGFSAATMGAGVRQPSQDDAPPTGQSAQDDLALDRELAGQK